MLGGLDFKVTPWAHQIVAINRATTPDNFALFFEMGTGKTLTAIGILRQKYQRGNRLLRTLVLGPPIVIQNWKREFETHSDFGDKVLCLEGSGKKRADTIGRIINKTSSVIFVTNYEALLMPDVFTKLLAWAPEVIVFDESHKIKNIKSKRTKLAIKLSDTARHRYILTGTPVLNSPMDLFSQYRALDGGETFGKNFFVFRANYFEDKNAFMPRSKYFPNWHVRSGALEELNDKIKATSMVVKKSECLDLPPLVKKQFFVELSKEQRRLYETMKKDFVAYVGTNACFAPLAITKALRMQQIVSGFITLAGEGGEDQTNLAIGDNPRAHALHEILAEVTLYSKCLVWAVFRENYATIRKVCDEIGIKYVECHGEVAANKRQEAVDLFNNSADVRVFIGHPGSAGIGINLVAANYSIFYSRSFSLEQDLQAEARNYRGGSEIHEKITRIDLVAKDTIDEIITEKLAGKIEIGDKILRDIAVAL